MKTLNQDQMNNVTGGRGKFKKWLKKNDKLATATVLAAGGALGIVVGPAAPAVALGVAALINW